MKSFVWQIVRTLGGFGFSSPPPETRTKNSRRRGKNSRQKEKTREFLKQLRCGLAQYRGTNSAKFKKRVDYKKKLWPEYCKRDKIYYYMLY